MSYFFLGPLHYHHRSPGRRVHGSSVHTQISPDTYIRNTPSQLRPALGTLLISTQEPKLAVSPLPTSYNITSVDHFDSGLLPGLLPKTCQVSHPNFLTYHLVCGSSLTNFQPHTLISTSPRPRVSFFLQSFSTAKLAISDMPQHRPSQLPPCPGPPPNRPLPPLPK